MDPAAVDAGLRRLARAEQPPWLHAEVARRMAERLALIRLKPALLLDWWGHGGASAALLQQAHPQARRVVVEPTPALLARSLQATRAPWWSARRWAGGGGPADAQLEAAPLPPAAQMVWANMMLHAVADPPALFARWHHALDVDGFVMFSCLGPGTLRELRTLYQRLGWGVPTQSFIDMHDLGDMLVHAGFADPVMDQEVLSLRWSSPQALLDELRTLGGNAAPGRTAGLRTPRWRERLLAELERLRGADGKVALSVEVAYGHAFKAAPRAQLAEATTVTLDEMRAMVRSGRRAD
ncbi:MAG: biotin synthase [Methylibium sp. NZG]|nr:MAG: biotin synthase [Methylibium sp. NZG]